MPTQPRTHSDDAQIIAEILKEAASLNFRRSRAFCFFLSRGCHPVARSDASSLYRGSGTVPTRGIALVVLRRYLTAQGARHAAN